MVVIFFKLINRVDTSLVCSPSFHTPIFYLLCRHARTYTHTHVCTHTLSQTHLTTWYSFFRQTIELHHKEHLMTIFVLRKFSLTERGALLSIFFLEKTTLRPWLCGSQWQCQPLTQQWAVCSMELLAVTIKPSWFLGIRTILRWSRECCEDDCAVLAPKHLSTSKEKPRINITCRHK